MSDSKDSRAQAEAWLHEHIGGLARGRVLTGLVASLKSLLEEQEPFLQQALALSLDKARLTDQERDRAEARIRELEANLECNAEPPCGQCLVCKSERVRELEAAIKEHHDQKADDRCFEDDARLYAAAGLEPADVRVGDKEAMLRNCARFIERRCEGGGWPTYVELEAEVATLRKKYDDANRMRGEALTAVGLLQNDLDRALDRALEGAPRVSDSEMMSLLRRRAKYADTLEAEVERKDEALRYLIAEPQHPEFQDERLDPIITHWSHSIAKPKDFQRCPRCVVDAALSGSPAATKEPERIVAAAIQWGGITMTGPHHHQIIRYISAMWNVKPVLGAQGFVTSSNRFVGREEGARIAFATGQIKEARESLFSEQLWLVKDAVFLGSGAPTPPPEEQKR